MTQWFLEKALSGFPERGLCSAKGGGPGGPELVLKPAGIWVRGPLCRRVLVFSTLLAFLDPRSFS